jgi:hypothetical protein
MSDPPKLEPERRLYPVVGTFDHLECSVGNRGMGKSTYDAYRALVLSREAGGAYVLGHSLGARLPDRLPTELGGEQLPITYHTTLDKLERGLRRKPNRWHILAPPPLRNDPAASADALIQYAIRLSVAVRKAAWNKLHPFSIWRENVSMAGVRCPPVIIVIDEGIAVQAAGTTRKDENKWFLEFLYSLRHFHIALLYAIQDTTARSWRVMEQANEIHCFRVRHQWALQALQAAGATRDEIERIQRLEKYQRVTLDMHSAGRVVDRRLAPAPTNEAIAEK